MAFWGVEVRPGNPFTHFFDPQRGRLHISQATLGNGSASQKSVVQCNVGDKSPVLLCALLPDKTESCGLALEFEEAEDVTFSVVGPRSVHLTGYYLGCLRNSMFDDDIEPLGEDIENTDSGEADLSDDEDDSDDSFINDGDPEYFSPSPSPVPDSGVGDKDGEEPDNSKPRKRKGRKRHKKYQFSDSDDGGNIPISKGVNGRARAIALGSDDEELPVSSPRKPDDCGNNNEVEPGKKDEDDIGIITKNTENSMEVEPEERNVKELGMVTKNTENDKELEPSKWNEKDIGIVTENSKNMEVEPEKRDDKELGMGANNSENVIEVGPEEGDDKDIGMATKNSENNLEVEPEKRDDKELGMQPKHSEKNIEVGPEEGDDKDIGMSTRNSENNMKVEPEERDDKEVDMATKNSEYSMEVEPEKRDDKELCMTAKDSVNNMEVEPEERDGKEIDTATKNFENNMEVKPEALDAEEVGLVTKNLENDNELEPGKRDEKEIGMETNKDDICVAETNQESNVCLIYGDAKRQSDLSCKPLLPCLGPVSLEKEAKPKKKRKQLSEERNTGEKVTKVGVEKKKHQEDQKSGSKKGNNLLSSEVMEDGPKQKKRRKERSKETDIVEADSVVPAKDKEGSDTRKEANIGNDESLNNMNDLKCAKKEKSENCTNQDASGKKQKKKKKKVKNQKNDEDLDTNLPTNAVRILSNGMEIEELEMGKPENKVAVQGKKVKVTYTGKLVDGDIFDSNVNTDPFRFRLGAGQVIEGWDIGIEGMRVGGRRRLKIPPFLGFGSDGDGENVPPHSWLIYDIELLRVS